jgi:hypothetical protein
MFGKNKKNSKSKLAYFCSLTNKKPIPANRAPIKPINGIIEITPALSKPELNLFPAFHKPIA